MKKDLDELVESFSLRDIQPETYSRQQLAQKLFETLTNIQQLLNGRVSKFVDIDTSFKDIDEAQAEVFKTHIAIFLKPQLEEDLFDLYRELNLYLIIKDRFGEAADWNLKVEFEERLCKAISNILMVLGNY